MTALPNYATPPINEVALGCRFAPLAALTLPLVGAFWNDALRPAYPHTEHAMPVGDVRGGVVVDEKTGLPWPRIWFLNESKSQLIQIQRDRFLLNWRQIDGGITYPRYPALAQELRARFDEFVHFAGRECGADVVMTACEATYINRIPMVGDLADMATLPAKVFNGSSWLLPEVLGTPKGFQWVNTYEVAGMGEMTIKAVPAKTVGTEEPLLLLELNAYGVAQPEANGVSPDISGWLDRAHEAIVTTFARITSPNLQSSLWGRIA